MIRIKITSKGRNLGYIHRGVCHFMAFAGTFSGTGRKVDHVVELLAPNQGFQDSILRAVLEQNGSIFQQSLEIVTSYLKRPKITIFLACFLFILFCP